MGKAKSKKETSPVRCEHLWILTTSLQIYLLRASVHSMVCCVEQGLKCNLKQTDFWDKTNQVTKLSDVQLETIINR